MSILHILLCWWLYRLGYRVSISTAANSPTITIRLVVCFFIGFSKLRPFNPSWTWHIKSIMIIQPLIMFMYEHMCLRFGVQYDIGIVWCAIARSLAEGWQRIEGSNENKSVYERNSIRVCVSFIFIIYYNILYIW